MKIHQRSPAEQEMEKDSIGRFLLEEIMETAESPWAANNVFVKKGWRLAMNNGIQGLELQENHGPIPNGRG